MSKGYDQKIAAAVVDGKPQYLLSTTVDLVVIDGKFLRLEFLNDGIHFFSRSNHGKVVYDCVFSTLEIREQE